MKEATMTIKQAAASRRAVRLIDSMDQEAPMTIEQAAEVIAELADLDCWEERQEIGLLMAWAALSEGSWL